MPSGIFFKYQLEGTSLNLNKGRSGRRKSARTEENIENVQTLLLQNAKSNAEWVATVNVIVQSYYFT